jgi:hypothetical protein
MVVIQQYLGNMTREEFEQYLISIGGLYNWKGVNLTNPSMFGVGEGWFQLLKNLIDELLSLGWDRTMIQSKEKFGGLNFYIKDPIPEMHDILLTYERLSYEICEVCGDNGYPRKLDWIKSLCDKHAAEKGID